MANEWSLARCLLSGIFCKNGSENAVRRSATIARCAAVVLLTAGAGDGAFGQQPSIVGTWEWTRARDGCAEQYVFRDNGTVAIRRGNKQTENTYLMSWAPEPNGRYKLTITTLKDDGGLDCDGSTEDGSGRRSIVYVLFGQSRESMIHCGSPEGTDCTGLMRRTAK